MTNYVHSISPIALPIYNEIAIRWYGLAYLAGLLIGLFLVQKMAKRGGLKFDQEQLSDFLTWAALGVMIGGRVGYCVFYSPDLLFSFSSSFPFWGVLEVWKGGMASHGGMIGVLVASYLYGRKNKIKWLHVNDVTVLGGSLGFFFGRIANFINGELYGRVVEKPLSWGVKFPQEMNEWLSNYQNKLYELKGLAGEVAGSKGLPEGLSSDTWVSWVSNYSTSRVANSNVRSVVSWLQDQAVEGNRLVLEGLHQVLPLRYPSQLIQAVLEGLLVFLILNFIWLKPRKPGIITAWFGILYSIARVIGEQFRMPDTGIGFQALGLTRGQWLSLALFIASLIVLYYSSRKENEKVKGW